LSTADPIDTPIPLHRGHLAMLLTAGRLTGSIGNGNARHLVKGRVIPHTEVVDDTPTHRISETRYRIELHTLHPDGTLQAWHTPHESPVMDPGDDGAEDASDA
jgi:hypothetical protein